MSRLNALGMILDLVDMFKRTPDLTYEAFWQ